MDGNKNNEGSDIPISPKDGRIDFSTYSTEQLHDLRHTIDGRSHPRDLRNLLTELSQREAAGPDTVIFRDSREYVVRFTSSDGIAGWLQSLASRSMLYGSGVIRFEGAHLVVVGWQRNWIGVPIETEIRVSTSGISEVELDGSSVSFSAVLHNGRRRRIRCLIDDAAMRQAIFDKLPATVVSAISASAAEWREFNRELYRTTPHAMVTGGLILACVVVFVAQLFTGSGFWRADPGLLTRWGANTTPLTVDGQSWRLVSAVFLHAGFIHLLLNMWTLWGIGRLTERLYGSALFVAIYACSGVIASLSSIAWHPSVVSVGASGAIFGVLGACLAFFLRTGMRIPRSIAWRHGLATSLFILFNLISGFVSEGIDNAAHVGGLLTGLTLGFLLARPLEEREGIALKPARVAAAVVVALLALGSGFWHMHVMARDRPAATRYWATHGWFIEGQAKALEAQAELQFAASSGRVSASQFALRFESEVFEFWRDAHERLEAEPEPQDPVLKAFADDVTEFSRRRREWATAMLDAARNDNSESFGDAMYYLRSANLAAAQLHRHELRAVSDSAHALSQSRWISQIRNLPLRWTWECVSTDAGPLEGAKTDGLAARRAAGCDAQRAFQTEDFALLEMILHPEGDELVTFDDGSSRLEGAVAGLSAMLDRIDAPQTTLSLLAKWQRAYPHSDGPDLVESLLFRSWAWQARGHGYAKEVSPQAWVAYELRIGMAAAALTDAADKPEHSPAYYPIAISLGVDQSRKPAELRRHVDFSMSDYPDYFAPHQQMLRALLPKWGGSYSQIEEYVESVQARMPAERRSEMYARLYTRVAVLEGDEVDVFTDTMATWPRMKEGYEDMLNRYPRSDWLRNKYAVMACRAKDVETYHAVIAAPGFRILPEAWRGKYSVDACDQRVSTSTEGA